MRTIRLSFAWCFVLLALISASVAIKLSSVLTGYGISPIRAAASFLFMPSLAILYALASWSIFSRRASARVWGTLASLALAVSLGWPIFFERPLDLLNPMWFLAAGGLAGTVIFARRDTEASRKPQANVPHPGDGTNRLLNYLATLAGIAAATGGIQLWEHWARAYDLPDIQGPAFYLGFVIVILLVMVIHEAGHAIAAMAVDMKVISFSIGPFQAWMSESKWKFHFRPAGLLSLLGVIHVVPTKIENFRRRKLIQIAAGPFTSIATGLIAAAVLLTAPGHPWEAHWRSLADFANISLAVGLVNLIPFGIKGGYSDGAKLYQLRRDGVWANYQCQLGVSYATAVTSLRPRDFDIETIEQAAGTIALGEDELHMRLCAYCFYLDTERLADADLALAKIEKFCQESGYEVPEGWYSMFVFAIGFLRRDAAGARLWWERLKAKPSFQFDDSLWDSRCALLLSENRLDEAAEAWEKADTWSRQLPAAGAWEAQRYAVTLLGQALEESRAMSLSPS